MRVPKDKIKLKIIGIDLIKERLHLRIEQADEKLLSVLAEVTESLFKSYQPDMLEENRQQRIGAYEASSTPMTKDELIARALASQADIEAGRVHDIEELETYPELGPEEEHLRELEKGHRSLLVGTLYKIIYLIASPFIVITDIFDTRQNTDKMKP